MPIRTRASRWHDPGFQGLYFSTSDPDLADLVAAADGPAPALLAPVLAQAPTGHTTAAVPPPR